MLLVASALHWRRRPALEHVGRISYGLYLFHVPVHIFMSYKVMAWGPHPIAYAAVLFLLTFPLAQGSWMLIERRFVRRRRSRREVGVRPAAAAAQLLTGPLAGP